MFDIYNYIPHNMRHGDDERNFAIIDIAYDLSLFIIFSQFVTFIMVLKKAVRRKGFALTFQVFWFCGELLMFFSGITS